MLVSLVLTAAWGLAADPSPGTTTTPTLNRADHLARAAHVTMRDGTCADVLLEGVGCPVAICSRVAIESRADGKTAKQSTPFDRVAKIEGLNGSEALFVLKDGTIERRAIVRDNRVLYVTTRDGRQEKIDLAALQSLAFHPSPAPEAR
jgi:hypothetical protein